MPPSGGRESGSRPDPPPAGGHRGTAPPRSPQRRPGRGPRSPGPRPSRGPRPPGPRGPRGGAAGPGSSAARRAAAARRSGGTPSRTARRDARPSSPKSGPSRLHAACAASTSVPADCHFASTAAWPPIVFCASASRRRAARSAAVWTCAEGGPGESSARTRLDARDELLGLAVDSPRDRARCPRTRRGTPARPRRAPWRSGPRTRRARRGAGCRPAATPSAPPGAARRGRPAPRPPRRRPPADEGLERGHDLLARRLRGVPRVLVAVLVAVEEVVAGGAEALPHRVGARLLDRADRAPLGLQPLELRRGGVPVASTRAAPRPARRAPPSSGGSPPTRACAGCGAPASA